MELERDVLVSPTAEVPVIEGELVTAIRTLAGRGVGKKTIAREVGVAVNTVRRYLRQPIEAGVQVRPAARRLTDERRREARALYEGPAAGNAVVVQRLLAERGLAISVRTIERAVADIRRAQRVAAAGDGARGNARRAISCRSISARSACRLPARGCASSCWSPCSATRGASSSKRFSMSAGTIGAKGIAAALHAFRRRAAHAARRQCAGVGRSAATARPAR